MSKIYIDKTFQSANITTLNVHEVNAHEVNAHEVNVDRISVNNSAIIGRIGGPSGALYINGATGGNAGVTASTGSIFVHINGQVRQLYYF